MGEIIVTGQQYRDAEAICNLIEATLGLRNFPRPLALDSVDHPADGIRALTLNDFDSDKWGQPIFELTDIGPA